MYGLLLDSIQKFLCEKYGEQRWEKIRRRANLKHIWFVTHEVYGEEVLMDLVKAASAELEEASDMVMRMFGEYFARNIGHYGYARLLRVLGRDLRDFLNGLDDLHEYLRFSYPKMAPPSFFCESETEHGLVLHYTTKRKGYLEYVIGQLTTVGRIYGKDLEINVVSEEKVGLTVTGQAITHFTLELKFDNSELLLLRRMSPMEKHFSVDASTFLGVFPFCVLFDEDLMVWREGVKLMEVLPDLVGNHLQDCFSIRKPMLPKLSWRQVSKCFLGEEGSREREGKEREPLLGKPVLSGSGELHM
jgi:guanylate cyclase